MLTEIIYFGSLELTLLLAQITSLARNQAIHASTSTPTKFRQSLVSRNLSFASDLSFPAQHETAVAEQRRDLKVLTTAVNDFLSKASSNFALEITSTELLMRELANVEARVPESTVEYNDGYVFALMLARGASFSK
jgi:hypothetical protein